MYRVSKCSPLLSLAVEVTSALASTGGKRLFLHMVECISDYDDYLYHFRHIYISLYVDLDPNFQDQIRVFGPGKSWTGSATLLLLLYIFL